MHGSSQATPCVSCGLELNGRTCDEVVELKRLYEELVPSNDLDTALVTEWGASELEELLNEESDDMID